MTIGIYCIRNTIDGKRYIGKSKNIEGRWASHRNEIKNRYLRSAVNKYGIEAFAFEIIESFDAIDEDMLAEREIFWMDHFHSCDRRSGYNLRRDSSVRIVVSEETKTLISLARSMQAPFSPEARAKMTQSAKARWDDPVYRSKALGGRMGQKHSTEHRSRISESGKRRWADEEYREGMLQKRRTVAFRSKISAAGKGRIHSAETRFKMSVSQKGRRFRQAFDAILLWVVAI